MKKFLITICLLAGSAMLFTGCKKELEEKYFSPDKSTSANIPGLFAAMLNNDRVRPSYWNIRTFLLTQASVYSQTSSYINGNTAYQQNDSYSQQYWNDFYAPTSNGGGPLGLYRAMEVTYNALPESEKKNQEVIMKAAQVVVFDEASKMIDLWGDIPFSEAGSLHTSSTIKYGKFDDQKELYNIIIKGLDEAATYFGSASTNASFSKYDILAGGSVDKWRRYANSIRLRLLMRTSNVDESTAKTEVLKMLANPSQYPLVDGGNAATYNPLASDILLRPLTTYTDNLNSALTEIGSYYAPDYMLNTVMLPANDPRIPVMFDKYGRTVSGAFVPNATYRAMPVTFTTTQQEGSFPDYSILDSATFLQNPALPGIVITAPEVNFLKAEAYERWGSGDATATYNIALRQSVTFYYYLNSLNTTGLARVSVPSTAVVDAFVNTSTASYSGSTTEKLGKIYTQKWLHFGFLQSIQAWSEYRRTGYPALTFPAQTLAGYQTPPTRLVYPPTEKSLNFESYESVKAKDTRTTKIFWDVN